MKRETITANRLQTICWFNDTLIDWPSAGELHFTNGTKKRLGKYHYSYNFDSAVISSDGQYSFTYGRLGTKGLLLKNGELLREINRSYYCADVYEYPAVFLTRDNITYLIHCPEGYNRLEFENVETGEIITNVPGREPIDFFHSRLEIAPSGKFLMSKGWYWHPLDGVYVFNIEDCIKNPLLLDKSALKPDHSVEICTASFINGSKVLIGSSDEVFNEEGIIIPPLHIGIWDFQANQITNMVKMGSEFGNLYAINEEFAWDTFNYPKIINIKTGKVVDEEKSIFSGKQKSSIIHYLGKLPLIAFNKQTKQLAVGQDDKIEILTPF